MSFLSNMWDHVKSLFHNASGAVHEIITVADKVANTLKNLEASQAGQFLETTLETLVPPSAVIINGIKLWLPKVVTDLNWAVQEDGKTDEQKIADAVAYLAKLKGVNPDAYASQLNTLNALIQKWMSDQQGAGLNIQQALTISQVNHNPDLVSAS